MNPTPAIPEPTTLDAVTHLLTAAIYLAVGASALAQAPRDERTRVFSALGLMHAIGLCIPTAGWFLGVKDPMAFNRIPLAVTLSAFSLSAILMFHFSQVFPRRRPWIRASGLQLPVAYALTPVVVFMLVRWWSDTPQQVTPKFGLLFLVFGFPLIVVLGLVLPVAGIVSFLRSLREAGQESTAPDTGPGPIQSETAKGTPNPRPAITGILVSQLGAAALSLLVLVPLSAAAPGSIAVAIATLGVFLLGILTPLAFAAGVWKYKVLSIGDRSTEVEPE